MGESGYSGISGFSGLNGDSGWSGYSGASGFSGIDGASGFSGTQGVSGFSGQIGGPTYAVTNSGASSYTINGGSNPTLNLIRGFTYYFNVSAPGHPFWIKTSQVTGTGSAYNTGVTNNGTDNGVITFTVPFDAPSTLYYICQFHASMSGAFNVSDTGISGFSGAQGPQGTSGFSGAQGAIGTSGFSGAEGAAGASGFSGAEGSMGLSGYSGINGAPGNIGAQGASGYSGEIGSIGQSGYSGDQGFSGYSGAAFVGSSGYSGATTVYTKSYSAFFDGNNDYLQVPANNNLVLGTGNFTIECWIYRTGININNAMNPLSIIDYRTAVPTNNICLQVRATDFRVSLSTNEVFRLISTTVINLYQWYHVALVRSSGVTRLYINGVQEGGNYTDTTNYPSNVCVVGARFAISGGDWRSWNGNISNFRIVRGTAVYTTNFTPPVNPLTPITNTSLLTCNQETLNSVIPGGTVLTSKFNPFGETPTAGASGFSGTNGSNGSNGTSGFSGRSGFSGLSGYSGAVSLTPTFTTVTTTTLNTQTINFTGTGPVNISSGNDINLAATGWVTFSTAPRLPNKTLAQLNALVNVPAGAIAICTDASGGAKPVWYNGSAWKDMMNGSV